MLECPVMALLTAFEAAVLRLNELDEPAVHEPQAEAESNATWDRLRALESRAMKAQALSETGRTLQLVLAVVEANTLGSWAGDNPGAAESNARLRATLRSLLAVRDVTALPAEVVQFYLGNLVRRLWPEPEAAEERLH